MCSLLAVPVLGEETETRERSRHIGNGFVRNRLHRGLHLGLAPRPCEARSPTDADSRCFPNASSSHDRVQRRDGTVSVCVRQAEDAEKRVHAVSCGFCVGMAREGPLTGNTSIRRQSRGYDQGPSALVVSPLGRGIGGVRDPGPVSRRWGRGIRHAGRRGSAADAVATRGRRSGRLMFETPPYRRSRSPGSRRCRDGSSSARTPVPTSRSTWSAGAHVAASPVTLGGGARSD